MAFRDHHAKVGRETNNASRLLLLAGVLAWGQVTQMTKGTFLRVFRDHVLFVFVRSITDRLAKTTVQTF